MQEFSPPLDKGIERAVITLLNAGIETYESCEGGEGHAFPEPTIRFHGDRSEGFRALSVALQNNLPVGELKRVWHIIDGEPVGPTWEISFARLSAHQAHEKETRDMEYYLLFSGAIYYPGGGACDYKGIFATAQAAMDHYDTISPKDTEFRWAHVARFIGGKLEIVYKVDRSRDEWEEVPLPHS